MNRIAHFDSLSDSGAVVLIQPVFRDKVASSIREYSDFPVFAIQVTNISEKDICVTCPQGTYPSTEMCDYEFASMYCVSIRADSSNSELVGAKLELVGEGGLGCPTGLDTLSGRTPGRLGEFVVGDFLRVVPSSQLPNGKYWIRIIADVLYPNLGRSHPAFGYPGFEKVTRLDSLPFDIINSQGNDE